MAFTLPDPTTDFGARVAQRLRDEVIGWLTLVDRAGTPQPAPVWFLWDDEAKTALVYNQPTAKRIERVRANPRSALHLNDHDGGNFVVLTGRTEFAPDSTPRGDEHAAYLAKYGKRIDGAFGSAERFADEYSVPLLFVPERVRGY